MRNNGHPPSRQPSYASTQATIVGPSSDLSNNKNDEQSLVLCDRQQRDKHPRAIPEARGYTVPHGMVAVATSGLHAERNGTPGIQCDTSHPTTCYEKYFYDGTRAIESRRTASRCARSHGTTYEEQLVGMAYQRGLDSSRVERGLTGGYMRRL